MTPSFMISPAGGSPRPKRTGFKEMAMFGLRKAFVDPAPRPKRMNPRMGNLFADEAMGHWLPE